MSLVGTAFFGGPRHTPGATNGTGEVVTWNASDRGTGMNLSGGDLVVTRNGASSVFSSIRATAGLLAGGKGYFEIAVTVSKASTNFMLYGIANSVAPMSNFVGSDANGWGYYEATGQKYTNNVATAFGAAYAQGDVVGVAFDNGKIWFAKNNVWQGSGNPAAGTNPTFTGLTGTLYPCASLYNATFAPVDVITGRFKSADFSYSPPAGFNPWGV